MFCSSDARIFVQNISYKWHTKHHERIQKFREKGNLKHIYKNELKIFFHDAACSDSKDLAKRTVNLIKLNLYWKFKIKN